MGSANRVAPIPDDNLAAGGKKEHVNCNSNDREANNNRWGSHG